MKAPKIAVVSLILIFALSSSMVFAQATPAKPQEPKKPEAKQPPKEMLPKEMKAIMLEGLATRRGRQDIPFTIFKSLVFPVPGGMQAVVFFKAKNADLGYGAPLAPAPAPKNKPVQPAATAAVLETRLAVAIEFFQADEAGALKVVRDTGFPVALQTESAGYDANKEEWYTVGYPLPSGKYTVAMLLAPLDAKKATPDLKKVGVSYCDLTLPEPKDYSNALETTEILLLRSMEQTTALERRPTIHKDSFMLSVLKMVPNIDNVVTVEDHSQIEVFFFVLGAKPKEEPPAAPQVQPAQKPETPKYEIVINYQVKKDDGSTVIRWPEQNYPSPGIDQPLPLKRTLKTGEKTEVKDLDPGKYILVIKIKDKVSGFTAEKKVPFEVK